VNAVPAIPPRAQYPQLYHAARAALMRCDQVDECAKWANKAAAIASYAAQANDKTLAEMAARIQARAMRRMGELLERVPPVPPTETRKAAGLETRSTLAASAGISEHKKSQALQVARVPAEKFEQLIEAKKPARISVLATLGRKKRGGKHCDPKAEGRLERMAGWCRRHPVDEVPSSAEDYVREIRAWCEAFLEAT
jgi:hypothetical protein